MTSIDDLFGVEGSRRARSVFIAVPVLLLLVAAALLGHPATREQARPWLLFENGPVELLTFGFFTVGGLGGLALAVRAARMGLPFTSAFYIAYSLGLVFVAGEEIAWGQWIFHWATPEGWRAVNAQGETTLHNVQGLQDYLPVLHVAFAAGALVGIRAARVRALEWVATPRVLKSWFVLGLVHASLQLLSSIDARGSVVHKLFERTSEVMEMCLAIAAWLYVSLNARRLARSAVAEAGVPVTNAARGAPRTVGP